MFGATTALIVVLLLLVALIGRRNARRARTETPAQRAARIRNEKDTAVALFLVDDD